jgi:chondroitin AC lyase
LDGTVAALHTAGDEEILSEGEHSMAGPATICHGNVAYGFLSDSKITLRNASQEGSWQAISESLSAEPISRKVFLLGIDHGRTPRNGSYAYLVRPGIDPMRAKELLRESKIEILGNSPILQAVRHGELDLIQAVFYQAGSLVLDGKPIVEADRPCLLMIRDAGDELQLSVADPTQKHASVGVRVAGRLFGEGAAFDAVTGTSSVLLTFPTGPLAGATVLRTFKKGAVGL